MLSPTRLRCKLKAEVEGGGPDLVDEVALVAGGVAQVDAEDEGLVAGFLEHGDEGIGTLFEVPGLGVGGGGPSLGAEVMEKAQPGPGVDGSCYTIIHKKLTYNDSRVSKLL